MPAGPVEITENKLLIGEGVDEVRFFKALLGHLGLGQIQVEQYGGKTKLSRYLKNLPNIPGFAKLVSIGVTRDADSDPASALQSVTSGLHQAGLPSPSVHGAPQTITPKMTVFILPSAQNTGMLEDLCMNSVELDSALGCVDEYLACVLQRSNRQPANLAKARVHAWLASNVKPDLRLGEAAEAGLWPWASAAFDGLKEFLRDL
jgi:hypothetical protein